LVHLDYDPLRIDDVGLPLKDQKIPSTEGEKGATCEVAEAGDKWLRSLGFPAGVWADSGNGYHVNYSLGQLDNSPANVQLLTRCYKAWRQHFEYEKRVVCDTSFASPHQPSKVYGTMSRKGQSTPERPWRRSHLISAPQELRAVPREALERLAATLKRAKPEQEPTRPICGLSSMNISPAPRNASARTTMVMPC
jgi:hypothetical protein